MEGLIPSPIPGVLLPEEGEGQIHHQEPKLGLGAGGGIKKNSGLAREGIAAAGAAATAWECRALGTGTAGNGSPGNGHPWNAQQGAGAGGSQGRARVTPDIPHPRHPTPYPSCIPEKRMEKCPPCPLPGPLESLDALEFSPALPAMKSSCFPEPKHPRRLEITGKN